MSWQGGECDPPVESKLAHRLQDVDLPRLSELLAADAADDETACPPNPCTERTHVTVFVCENIPANEYNSDSLRRKSVDISDILLSSFASFKEVKDCICTCL